jgi:ADP-ribose pyrophosphatase YjhB (NUDIX family)
MEIKSTIKNQSGETLDVIYNDISSELDLGGKKIQGVHAYCFYGDKLVLVYSDSKGCWTPPGGRIEADEDVWAAVRREVKEEANMNVLKQCFIGCQDIAGPDGVVSQVRSVCIVEPCGPFVSDPDGEVTKIASVDPKDYKKYFDWGEIGDHIMRRALELKAQMDLETVYKIEEF